MTKSSMSSFSQQHQIDPKVLAQWTSKKQDRRTFIVFGILSIFFTIFGLLLAIYGAEVQEYSNKYSETAQCNTNDDCTVSIQVTEYMKGPVYVYYRLDNFFQNHQRYASSKDDEQLEGTNKPLSELGKCYPIFTNADVGVTTSVSDPSVALNPNDPAIPCGLIALTMFTEEFAVKKSGTDIPIKTTGIAWDSDKNDKRFKNIDLSKQWLNMEDEKFMNWMRLSGLNDFRKLYGIIEQDLEVGTYEITVSKWNAARRPTQFDVAKFDSGRFVILTTVNSFGGQNILLAVCYLLAAALSIIIWTIFLVRTFRNRKRRGA